MSNILTPEIIQRLRTESGAGMQQCVRALNATYTYEQAMTYLRLDGIALNTYDGPTRLERFLASIEEEHD